MNYALTLHRPAPIRLGLLLAISLIFMLAYGVSLAPTLVRTAASAHSKVCTCANCPGGAKCCCHCHP